MKRSKRVFIGCAGVFVTLVALGVLSVHDSFFSSIPFDSEAWRDGDIRLRGRMVQSLIDNGVLDGKYREEVEGLLGNGCEDGNALSYEIDIGERFGFQQWT